MINMDDEANTMTCPIGICSDDPADGRYYVACVHIDGWTAQIYFSQDDEDRDDQLGGMGAALRRLFTLYLRARRYRSRPASRLPVVPVLRVRDVP